MILRIQKNRWEHARFYFLLCVLIALLFVRYGLQIDIPRIVLTGVVALIALQGDRNEILAIAMCCIPLHEAVDFFYSLVACAAVYVLKYPNNIRINSAVILTLVMLFWELLHCFDPSFSPKGFLVSVIPLIFLAVVLCADVSDINYAFVVRALSVIVVATCIILLTNLIVQANFNLLAALEDLRRLGLISEDAQSDVMLGSAINPNSLGIICVLAAAGLLQLRTVGQNKSSDLLLMIILMLFGALTSSRTFLVCLALMLVLMILSQPGDFSKKLRFLCVVILITLAAYLLLDRLFPDLLEYYLKRFQVSDITTGRDDLMRAYHTFITDNTDVLFFGVGLQNYGYKLQVVHRVAWNLPHNSIQEIIVAWGIPGFAMFVLLLLMMILQSHKRGMRHQLLNYIPFLVVLIKSMAGQLLTSPYTMLALSYAYLSLSQNFQLKKRT